MAELNKVLIIGNLTRDPDVRDLPSGGVVCDMPIAVNIRYKDKQQRSIEEVCFIDTVCYGKAAEACEDYLEKGSSVFIEGRLLLDQWEKDGVKRSRIRIRAEKIQFLDKKPIKGNTQDDIPRMAN